MIELFELELLQTIQDQWVTMIANIGTADDLIPLIYAKLPIDGVGGANQTAIANQFKSMATGITTDDLKFVLQFPAGNVHIPCIDVEVGAEQEDPAVGAYVGEDDIDGDKIYTGSNFFKNFAVGVFSTNPETTLYLYSFVKYCVLLLRDSFKAVAIANITGRPIQQDFKTFAPHQVYVRYMDLKTNGCLEYAVQKLPLVTAVNTTYTTVEGTVDIKVAS